MRKSFQPSRRIEFAFLALTLATSLVLGGCSREEQAAHRRPPAAAAPAAPAFDLPLLGGGKLSLQDLHGKVAVIDFWATWCPPCLAQVPVLNALRESVASNPNVVILGVAVDAEGAGVVAPYVVENGLEYPVLLGSEDLALRYGAPGFPYLVILSPNGRIQAKHVGVANLQELLRQIESVESSLPAKGFPL